MKKLTVILLALAVVMLPSCKNQSKKKAAQEASKTEISQKEKLVTEELKLNLQALSESVSKMKSVPFIYSSNGAVKLSPKEKLVKPDYLLNPALVSDLVTLTQKYRAVAMLSVDKAVAELYDMPVKEYEDFTAKVAMDINDAALLEFSESLQANKGAGDAFSAFYDAEIEANRAPFFWEAAAAGMVEQLFVCTKNLDKFIGMFDDQSASDVTYNFVCVHEGIKSLIEFYPEMESLNTILDPLYVINAMNVEQLKMQLIELKGEIEVIRTALLN
ncbi:MAG: hypothetical protein IJS62_00460 [Bacteroidales bacterium]|nr:hypothetical protein [Bacteroidales bacterium]